jgi:hypothetical protein
MPAKVAADFSLAKIAAVATAAEMASQTLTNIEEGRML